MNLFGVSTELLPLLHTCSTIFVFHQVARQAHGLTGPQRSRTAHDVPMGIPVPVPASRLVLRFPPLEVCGSEFAVVFLVLSVCKGLSLGSALFLGRGPSEEPPLKDNAISRRGLRH